MDILLNGEVGVEITLYSVVAKMEAAKKLNQPINIVLTTIGGSSEEGRLIRDYLSAIENLTITAKDYVYSAGITILSAVPLVNRRAYNDEVEFLMHSPKFHPDYFDHLTGLSEADMEYLAKEIDTEKQELAKIYSEAMGIEKDTVINLMERDMIIDAETAKNINLIGGILEEELTNTAKPDYKIAAKWYANTNHKQIEAKMNEKLLEQLEKEQKETRSFFEKMFDGIMKAVKPNLKALMLNADEGIEIEFEGETLEVGTIVTSETPDGNYTVTYADKKWTVTIADKVVTELVEIVEEEAPADDVEALKAQIQELQKQLQAKNELQAKFDAMHKEVKEMQALKNKLEGITAKYVNDKGEFELKAAAPVQKSAKDELMAHIQAKKSKQ